MSFNRHYLAGIRALNFRPKSAENGISLDLINGRFRRGMQKEIENLPVLISITSSIALLDLQYINVRYTSTTLSEEDLTQKPYGYYQILGIPQVLIPCSTNGYVF